MRRRAFADDDLPHPAVVQHMVDMVVQWSQGLATQMQLGIDLNRLWRGFFVRQNAQAGIKAQAGQAQNLGAVGLQKVLRQDYSVIRVFGIKHKY